jgi:hypothetical protein
MPFMMLFVFGVITVAENIWKLFYTGYQSEKFLSQLYQCLVVLGSAIPLGH